MLILLWILMVISYFSFYGLIFPSGIIAYPVLTIFLVILSKVIFKKSFDLSYWKGLFVISLVFSLMAFGSWFLWQNPDILASLLNRYIEADERMAYWVWSMLLKLGPFVFFICYLINFIVRLVRRGKRKKEGDFPVQ